MAEKSKADKVKEWVENTYNRAHLNPFKKYKPFTDEVWKQELEKQKNMKDTVKQAQSQEEQALADKYWEKVKENANNMINSGAEGYKDWSSYMSTIVRSQMDLFKALSASLGGFNFLTPVTWPLSKIGEGIGYLMPTHLKTAGLKAPDVEYAAEIDDKGALHTAVLVGGKEITAEHKNHFDEGLVAWALLQDPKYEVVRVPDDPHNPTGPKSTKLQEAGKPGVFMDQKTFEKLSRDPEKGLHKFLEGRFNLELKNTSSPSP